MKKIIITGCLGFIGSHVTEKFLKSDITKRQNEEYEVLGIDNCTYSANTDLIDYFSKLYDNFSFLKADIADLNYLPDCDIVINLAAETHVGNSISSSKEFIHTNVAGVQNLLELVRRKDPATNSRPLFLHFSTDEVYGDTKNPHWKFNESGRLSPSNPYSASKAAADMLILAWARTYNLDYLIVRPANNYGIRQHHEKFIPLSVSLLKREKKINLHNAGTPVRNWLHVEDTASAIFSLVNSNKKNKIYNISGDLEQDNLTTAKKIINCFFYDLTDSTPYLDLSYVRPGQDVRYSIDDTSLRTEIGWKPKKVFDEELQKVVDYYKSNVNKRW